MNHYYAMIKGEQAGPMNKCRLAMTGHLTPDTQVYTESLGQWTTARQVPELMELLENKQHTPGEKPVDWIISIQGKFFMNNTNGRFYIYDDHVTIVPSRHFSVLNGNFSKTGYRVQHYHLADIAKLRKGFLAKRQIILYDGKKINITTWDKRFFTEIERRRSKYFNEQGLVEPVLEILK